MTALETYIRILGPKVAVSKVRQGIEAAIGMFGQPEKCRVDVDVALKELHPFA